MGVACSTQGRDE